MTAPLPPPDDLDLLAAAIVDGHADEATLRRLADDPELGRRVAAQRRARAALASAVAPLPTADVDALVARAVGAADPPLVEPAAGGGTDTGREAVEHRQTAATGHPPAPDRHGGRPRGLRRHLAPSPASWLTAAAVVVVLALAAVVVPILAGGGRSGDEAASTAGSASSELQSTAGGGAAAGDVAGAGSADADLGAGSPEALAEAALQRLATVNADTAAEAPAAARAEDAVPSTDAAGASAAAPPGTTLEQCTEALAPASPVLWAGRGTVDGRPVDVVVVGPAPGTATPGPTALVIGAGCTLLAERAA